MSNSPSFPHMPTDQSLPYIGMHDDNNTAQSNLPGESAVVGPGGKTKIQPSNTPPHATEQVGYGYMSPDLKNVGMAPSGENSSGIPAAQPITPMMSGDPNNTAIDMDEAPSRG